MGVAGEGKEGTVEVHPHGIVGILGNNDHNKNDNEDGDGKDARTQQLTCGWMHSWQGRGLF